MLTEVTTDDTEWLEEVDDRDNLASTPYSTAASAIQRLSESLGSKTTLSICHPMIVECVSSSVSSQKAAGYSIIGLIAETCKEAFAKTIE